MHLYRSNRGTPYELLGLAYAKTNSWPLRIPNHKGTNNSSLCIRKDCLYEQYLDAHNF